MEQAWSRAEEHFELLDKVKKSVDSWLVALTKMSVAEIKLSADISEAFDPRADAMFEAAEANKQTTAMLDGARMELDRAIRDEFQEVLAVYVRQSGTLKRRKQERDRRLVDMDRYRHDYQRHAEKGDQGKSAANKRKYAVMKPAYEAINAELLRDIPLFISDCGRFFAPLFAKLYSAQVDFFARASELYGELLPHFGHIDRMSVHEHSTVVTPDEKSALHDVVDLATMPDRSLLLEQRKSYRSSGKFSPQVSRAKPAKPPPPRAPKKSAPTAVALYDFQGQDATELSFAVDSVITLVQAQAGQDWWEGTCNGQTGLFPSSYVEKK